MKLVIDRIAIRKLARVQPRIRETVLSRMERIAAAPFARHGNVEPLQGTKDTFRLRVGDWRVIYRVDRKSRVVQVLDFGSRGAVYE